MTNKTVAPLVPRSGHWARLTAGVLRRSRNLSPDCQIGQKPLGLRARQLRRIGIDHETPELPHPSRIRLERLGRIMAKHDFVFQRRFHLSPCRVRLFARAIGLNEDMRVFLHHSRLPDDALLLPCRETIFSVFRRGRRDSGVVSQRSQLRRQEHGVIFNRALCLGPLFGRLAFRSQFSYKQLKALGIGGTVAVPDGKNDGRTAPIFGSSAIVHVEPAWPRGPRRISYQCPEKRS